MLSVTKIDGKFDKKIQLQTEYELIIISWQVKKTWVAWDRMIESDSRRPVRESEGYQMNRSDRQAFQSKSIRIESKAQASALNKMYSF